MMLLGGDLSLSLLRTQPRNGYTAQRLALSHLGMVSSRSSIQSTRLLSLGKISCNSSKNLVNRFGGTLNVLKTLSNVLIMEQRNGDNAKFFMTVQTILPRPSQKACAKGDSYRRMRIKDEIYMRIQLKRPSNGNLLVKPREIQTPSSQKEVSILLNHPQLTRLNQLIKREDWKLQKLRNQVQSIKSAQTNFQLQVVHTVRP